MAPALLISPDDWAGRDILKRYLSGDGDWIIQNDSRWTQYMASQVPLRSQIEMQIEPLLASAWMPGSLRQPVLILGLINAFTPSWKTEKA
jgi:hypothetical protein